MHVLFGTYSAVIQQLLKGKGKEVEKSTNKVGQRVGDMEVWSFQVLWNGLVYDKKDSNFLNVMILLQYKIMYSSK